VLKYQAVQESAEKDNCIISQTWLNRRSIDKRESLNSTSGHMVGNAPEGSYLHLVSTTLQPWLRRSSVRYKYSFWHFPKSCHFSSGTAQKVSNFQTLLGTFPSMPLHKMGISCAFSSNERVFIFKIVQYIEDATEKFKKPSEILLSSVSDPDPHWICLMDLDPHSECGSGSSS
jgi:hypothetical protein